MKRMLFNSNLASVPSRRGAVVWHTAGGWVSNVLIVVQGLLLVPLYVGVLGDRLFGFWLASGGVLAWFSMIDIGGGAITKIRCAAAYGRKDIQSTVDYFWHGVLVTAAVVSLFAVLSLTLGPLVPGFIQADAELVPLLTRCLLLAALAVALGLVNTYLREFTAGCQRNGFPVIAQALGDLLGLAAIIWGLLVANLGLYALPLGAIVRVCVPLLLNLFYVSALLRSASCPIRWRPEIFRDYLTTTPALLAAKAAGVFSGQLPIVLITRWLGPEVSVAFSLATRLLEMAKHFINHPLSALYAASAHFFHDKNTTESKKRMLFGQIGRGFAVVTSAAALLYVLLNQGFLGRWVPEVAYLGHSFTVLAALGTFTLLLSTLFFTMIGSLGAIEWSGYAACLEKMLTAVLFLTLIRSLGVEGAPFAVVLSGVIFQQVYIRRLRRLDPVIAEALGWLRWLWVPQFLVLSAAVLAAGLFLSPSWLVFVGKAMLISVPLGLLALAAVPPVRDRLIDLLGKFLKKGFGGATRLLTR